MRSRDITLLLGKVRAGDTGARDELFQIVYAELRRLASSKMRGERHDHTLQPTALVHEVFLRLFDNGSPHWNDRAHFFAIASTEMRRILIDYARKHHSRKRGGNARRATLPDVLTYTEADADDVLALDIALDRLKAIKPEAALVVEMVYFGGMTQGEAAEVIGCNERTVKRRWVFARSFLLEEMSRESG